MGPVEKYTLITNSSSSSNYVAETVTSMDSGGMECWSSIPTGDFSAHPSSCPMPAHRGSHNHDVSWNMNMSMTLSSSHTAASKYKYYF